VESYTVILRGYERCGCGLETISFNTIVMKAESRRLRMCSVCLTDKVEKTAVNSVSVQNVFSRTALTFQVTSKS
jgi:hypothetical protein